MFGFVVSVPQKYEQYTLKTLTRLRQKWKLDHPIEIWEIGKEVSEPVRAKMAALGNVTFRNVEDHTGDPRHWLGFQSKAFAARHNGFDEFVLFDADVTFFQNPLVIHDDPGYRSTGTFFFRDQRKWRYRNLSAPSAKDRPKNKWESLEYFNGRKAFLHKVLPLGSPYFPPEWAFFYQDGVPTQPVAEAYMEAGVIYLDAKRHADSIDAMFRLNDDHKTTYEFLWGDKDTWWLGCCLAGKPHAINETYPISSPPLIRKVLPQLTHFYHGLPFFGQK